jgi:transcriptional regulator with XRE-family HTH domain
MSVLQDMAVKLRQCREYMGFTQADVARVLGLHRSAVAEVEAGRRKATAGELKALARLHHKPVDYFLGEAAPDVSAAAGALAAPLEEGGRQELLRFAEFLAWKRAARRGDSVEQ